jgi:hypothetical protein
VELLKQRRGLRRRTIAEQEASMVNPANSHASRSKWLWPTLILLLGVLAIIVLFDPSGDGDGTVEDPIVIEDMGTGTGVGQSPAQGEDAAPAPEPFAPGGDPEG